MIKKILHNIWLKLTGAERVFVVTKTVNIVASTRLEAKNKAKIMPANHPLWVWDVKGDADELF